MRNPLTTQTVTDELKRLLTAFPRRGEQNIPGLADVYKHGLVGVETEALRGAVSRCIQTDEFFPKVARLRELADEWMRRNRAQFAPVTRESWDICGVCGARASRVDVVRPKMVEPSPDPRTWTQETDDAGKPVFETVLSQGTYMSHDPVLHHVTPERDGAA